MLLRRFIFVFSIAVLPLLFGCPDRKSVMTKINKDGSCTRMIGDFDPREFKGIDSVKLDIPIPIDSSWQLKKINDTTAVLSKHFNSVGELNRLFFKDESMYKVYKRNVELLKNFRWFHTQYIYKESYGGIFTKLPISNYMSEEEVQTFKMDDSDDSHLLRDLDPKASEALMDNIEERGDLWLNDNLMAIFFDDIVEIAFDQKLTSKQDLDIVALYDSVKLKNDIAKKRLEFDFTDDFSEIKELVTLIGIELELDSIALDILIKEVELANLEDIYDSGIFASLTDDYNNELFMPGLLIDTNADEIRGDTLFWDVNFVKFMDADYIMSAESRVTNLWAYIVSGFILTIALIIPFLRKKKV